MNEKDRQGVTTPSQRPRSPRVPVAFTMDVEGKDSSGESFKTKAQTIKISRGGATILIDVDVAVGSVIKLTPPFGSQLDAQVNGVWHDEMNGRLMMGIKLLDADGWFAD
jgi:hypothetical protein